MCVVLAKNKSRIFDSFFFFHFRVGGRVLQMKIEEEEEKSARQIYLYTRGDAFLSPDSPLLPGR